MIVKIFLNFPGKRNLRTTFTLLLHNIALYVRSKYTKSVYSKIFFKLHKPKILTMLHIACSSPMPSKYAVVE